MQTVGIIGVGEIGWRMGKLLATSGFSVVAYDIAPQAIKRADESGFHIAADVYELCRKSDCVITCVTDGRALQDVIESSSGILAGLSAGKLLIDTTSAEPWITKELAPRLQERGILFLDAPVSGGVPAADQGRMNFMIGGDAAVIERCRPILKPLSAVIAHAGPIGTGHTVKTINMLALASSMVLTSELVALGMDAGETPDQIISQFDHGPGASYSTRVHFPKFILPGNFSSGFTFDLMLKDLAICISLSDKFDVPTFLQRSTYDFYRGLSNTGMRGKDNTYVVQSILPKSISYQKSDRNRLVMFESLAGFCNTIIGAESICLGFAAGIRPEKIIEILRAGSGDSFALSNVLPTYLEGKPAAQTSTLSDMWKLITSSEVGIATSRRPIPLLRHAVTLAAQALDRYGPDADSRSVISLIGELTGQKFNTQTDELR
ncbi:MAG: NAD(P)-binding domain-containing protein [Afipia sp.]|nr:NAD(P)-binding domain-containing protein [Afipia sp.]